LLQGHQFGQLNPTFHPATLASLFAGSRGAISLSSLELLLPANFATERSISH